GDDAPRSGHSLFRAEGACGASQEGLRANEIAELRHRDASERERRRILAQRDPLQRAEGITRCQRTRRGGDHRVHRNPVTLVTPIRSIAGAKFYPVAGNQHMKGEAMTKHSTGTRKEWLAARLELLEAEKELTRRSDELAGRRQELPWVRIDKEYRLETDEG